MAGQNAYQAQDSGKYTLHFAGHDVLTVRYTALLVILAIAGLWLIRIGFRGVNFMGASASVG